MYIPLSAWPATPDFLKVVENLELIFFPFLNLLLVIRCSLFISKGFLKTVAYMWWSTKKEKYRLDVTYSKLSKGKKERNVQLLPKPSGENHALKVKYFVSELRKLKLRKGISGFSYFSSGLSNTWYRRFGGYLRWCQWLQVNFLSAQIFWIGCWVSQLGQHYRALRSAHAVLSGKWCKEETSRSDSGMLGYQLSRYS